MALRAVITDDEASARAGVRALLSRDRDVEVVAECANVTDTLRAIVERRPELLFLDVQLSGSSGLELLERVPEKAWPVVIFVTAYETYARHAFDCHAADYLLKPYEDARFFKALERAKQRIEQRDLSLLRRSLLDLTAKARGPAPSDDAPHHAPTYLTRVMIKTGTRVAIVRVADIDWIEAYGDYVQLHVGAKTILHRITMNELEQRLDPRQFVRIHRSSIVKVSSVVELRRVTGEEYIAVLAHGATRPVSARGWRRLEEAMGSAL
jgi:two-component system, LytTR family, response regulator